MARCSRLLSSGSRRGAAGGADKRKNVEERVTDPVTRQLDPDVHGQGPAVREKLLRNFLNSAKKELHCVRVIRMMVYKSIAIYIETDIIGGNREFNP